MHGLDFLRLGSDCLSTEASFIWLKDVLCGTKFFMIRLLSMICLIVFMEGWAMMRWSFLDNLERKYEQLT